MSKLNCNEKVLFLLDLQVSDEFFPIPAFAVTGKKQHKKLVTIQNGRMKVITKCMVKCKTLYTAEHCVISDADNA